jgi:3-hydroxybutyryl-CoA dehydrogenase
MPDHDPIPQLRKIGVAGAGTMGSGIAHVAAENGFEVLLYDLEDQLLERALSGISRNMDRQVARDRLTEEQKDEALGRIETVQDLSRFRTTDFVVEAVPETLQIKSTVFRELDSVVNPEVILASNTSSISVTSIGETTGRPEMVIGMHFMNPVPMMELVEVVRSRATSDRTLERTMELARGLGKTPVHVNDSPGFVSNRILIPMINEAVFCLMENVADAAGIDSVMKLGMKHPLGPLALADLIGLDVCLNIMEVLHQGLGDSKYRPCPLLREMVESGRLGRKSGQGFYSY